MQDRANIEKLVLNHKRRLQKLKEYRALHGISVDPSILIEIEDIEAKIAELREELEPLKASSQVSSSKAQIEITFAGDFALLKPDARIAAIKALAGILNIPADQIEVLYIQQGSIIIKMELPEEAKAQLMILHEAGTPIILDLGDQTIQVTEIKATNIEEPSINRKTSQIFLSYSRHDGEQVEKVYDELLSRRFRPWMDTKDIFAGEEWKKSIRRAIRKSDFFVACLSKNAVGKRGFLRTEIQDALEIWKEKREDDIYLIPVRLDDCEIPENLQHLQWVDLFAQDGLSRLVKAIEVGTMRL